MLKPTFTNFSIRLCDLSELFFIELYGICSKYSDSFPKSTLVVPRNICLFLCQGNTTNLVVA